MLRILTLPRDVRRLNIVENAERTENALKHNNRHSFTTEDRHFKVSEYFGFREYNIRCCVEVV